MWMWILPYAVYVYEMWMLYVCLLPAGDAGRRCGCVDVMLLPAGDAGHKCLWMKCLQVPMRPLSLPERRLTSVPANSGTPYVHFLAKVMPKFFVKFGMTLLKNRTYDL